MSPIVVHVVRPYSEEQAYLAAEAWSIDARGMLLIDAEPLAPDTVVLFDVALSDGQKPIRAEGRVVSSVLPNDGRPGGLRVRFKRFGAATKAFIERAVQAQKQGPPERLSQPPSGALELPSAPDASRASLTEIDSQPSVTDIEGRPSATEIEASFSREPSYLRKPGIPGPISAPANREELLERLRRRKSQTA